ncbi:MAG: hypothetical protein ACREM3_13945 [Candidatus Rokuibacteriota bacterium]
MSDTNATRRFPCPWLRGDVELSEERELHIQERHPELLPAYRDKLAEVLADPDMIRRSVRAEAARLFSRWYTDVRQGRHVVVVVFSEHDPSARHWIVTAYTARILAAGEIEWHRS